MPSAQYTPSSPGSTPRLDLACPQGSASARRNEWREDRRETDAQGSESACADFVAAGAAEGHLAANSFARAPRQSQRAVPTNILAIRPGALGDALLAWPALALLRRLAPSTHLHLVSRADVLPLALRSGLVDETTPYDDPRWLGLFASGLPAPPEAASAAVVVAWLDDPDGAVASRLRAICPGHVLVIPGRPDATRGEHAAQQLLAPLATLGLPTPAPGTPPADLRSWLPPLDVGDEAREAVARWWEAQGLGDGDGAAPVVALHAGSGGAAKRWPAERYGLLAADLGRTGARPVLVTGPQDAEVSAAVQAAAGEAGPAVLPEARDFALADVAALLQRCAAFVGNDSGIAHLAGLLAVPTIALFGPTDPVVWAPLGGMIVRAPAGDLARLDVAEVWATVLALLGEQRKHPPF